MTDITLTGIRISNNQLETVTISRADTVTDIQKAIGARWFDLVSLDAGRYRANPPISRSNPPLSTPSMRAASSIR